MNKLNIGLRILVGLVFLFQGVMKVTGVQNEWRDELDVAPWFWLLVGIVQLIGATGLLASLRWERLALPFSVLFVVIMTGAIITHFRVSDPVSHMVFPLVMLLTSAAIAWISFRGDHSSPRANRQPTETASP